MAFSQCTKQWIPKKMISFLILTGLITFNKWLILYLYSMTGRDIIESNIIGGSISGG